MRKLDLRSYRVGETEFDVRLSCVHLLFADPVSGMELRKRDALARTLETAGDHVLLEEAQYQLLKQAADGFTKYERMHLEFFNRIQDCPEVAVQEFPSLVTHGANANASV